MHYSMIIPSRGVRHHPSSLLLPIFLLWSCFFLGDVAGFEPPEDDQEPPMVIVDEVLKQATPSERRLDTSDFTSAFNVADAFDGVSEKLEEVLGPLSRGDSAAALNTKIPFVGKSINALVAGAVDNAGIGDVLNIANFIDKVTEDNPTWTMENLQEQFNTLFIPSLKDFLVSNFGAESADVESAPLNGNDACDAATLPISLSLDDASDALVVDICVAISVASSTALEAGGLFDSLDEAVEIDLGLAATLMTTSKVSFATQLKIDTDLSEPNGVTVSVNPTVSVDLTGTANVNAILELGMLDLASMANVTVAGSFDLTFQSPMTSSSPFELESLIGFEISGDISLSTDFPGLVLPEDGANFTVTEANVFQPNPSIEFGFDLSELDIASFFDFSPQNAVGLLNKIDSALVRAQENEAFLVNNVPFTNTPYARLLSTGSVLTNKLVKYFVKPEAFENRPSQSLILKATKPADEVGADDDATCPVGQTKTLQFYFFGEEGTDNDQELDVNLDDQAGIAQLDGLRICSFNVTFLGTPYSSTEFKNAISNGIKSCDIDVCAASDCPDHRDDLFSGCDCDIVVDVDDSDLVFIASIAYDSGGEARDVELMGLYDPLNESPTQGAPSQLCNFPLNAPTAPGMVPRFRNFNDFTDRINMALASRTDTGSSSTAVSVAFSYIPAEEDDPSRIDLDIEFGVNDVTRVGFNASSGIGDLVDISLSNSTTTVSSEVIFAFKFAIIFAPNDEEQLVLIGNVCGDQENATFSCPLDATKFQLKFEDSMSGKFDTGEVSLVSSSGANAKTTLAELGPPFSTTIEFTEVGNNIVSWKFPPTVSFVELIAAKDCANNASATAIVEVSDTLSCSEKQTIKPTFNSYGLRDTKESKRPYQIGIGLSSINATVVLNSAAVVSANVGGVIEVEADVQAALSGNLLLTIGTEEPIRYTTWLGGITAILARDDTNPGYIEDFVSAVATFDGSFEAEVSALPPFDIIPSLDATGSFVEPYEINFLDLNATRLSGSPDVDFVVDLPTIGMIKDLSFSDVVDLLVDVLALLIGEGDDETPTSCSGGLLGTEIDGVAVFSYQIPVIGISACGFAKTLQVLVDAVDKLVEGEDSTFNALELKLEALLQDGVGGTPGVTLATSSNDGVSRLDLGLTLEWSFSEGRIFNVDLTDVLVGDEEEGLDLFLKAFVPASGEGEVAVDGKLQVNLAFGLEVREHIMGETEVLPFVKGTTGLKMFLKSEAETEFKASIGPFTGDVNLNVTLSGDSDDGELVLSAGLNESLVYYLKEPTPTFGTVPDNSRVFSGVTTFIKSLGNELNVDFQGRVDAALTAEVDFVNAKAEIDVQIPRVTDMFTGNFKVNETIFTNVNVVPPKFPTDFSFIDVLLADPQSLVDGLNNVFKTAEAASLGPNGIITNFPAPFVRNAIGQVLGANTKGNILAQARLFVVPALQEKLNGFEGDKGTVADVLARVIEDILGEVDLLKKDTTVQVTCFKYEDDEQMSVDCEGGTPSSIQWTIPFGQNFEIEMPLDFSLDSDFPVKLALEGNDVPTLCVGWSFDLAFGYDETEGFFLYTFPGDDAVSEFRVEALLSVPDQNLSASLFFLDVTMESLDLDVGASVMVDLDKSSALRIENEDPRSPNYGRLTQADFSKITQPSDLFVIGAVAGATFSAPENSVFLDVDASVNKYIPKLNFEIYAQLRKEIDIKEASTGARRRRLLHPQNLQLVGSLHEGTSHRAYPLLRSLRQLETGTDDVTITAEDFEFAECPVEGKTACIRVDNIELDVTEIVDFVNPIVAEFVNDDGDGYLDVVVKPLMPLAERLPGISDVAGKDIDVLSIAEIYQGASSGVQTVRKVIKIYEQIQSFAETLREGGTILLADRCDVLNGFNCTGGASDSDQRRLQHAGSYHDPFGLEEDLGGNKMTSRVLATCPSSITNCEGKTIASLCDEGCTKSAKAICRAAALKCKATSVEGLSFPVLSDPFSALGLLKGDDVQLVVFEPPEIVFAFGVDLPFVLYPAPTVKLVLGFEFSVRVRLGLVLDTSGIRQAIGPPVDLLKALNSFALKDVFDGVDEPLIVVTGAVTLDISVSAAIVKVGARGGVVFTVIIDLFDPFPEESGGLVRPFELLSLGTNPLDWFEFKMSITVSFEIYIRIGLYIWPVEVTIWEFNKGFKAPLIAPLIYTPEPPERITEINVLTGELKLPDETTNPLICTALSGDIGNEEIECGSPVNQLYRTLSAVKTLCSDPDGCTSTRRRFLSTPVEAIGDDRSLAFPSPESARDSGRALSSAGALTFRGVQSLVDISSTTVETLFMDYEDYESVLSNNVVIIKESKALIGVASVEFGTVAQGTIVMPVPELAFLTTTIDNCDGPWEIKGFSNIVVKADLIQKNCNITALGGKTTDAVLTIDFGSSMLDSTVCGVSSPNNKVVLTTSGADDALKVVAKISRKDLSEKTLEFGTVFKDVNLVGSICDDVFVVEKTPPINGTVSIQGLGGDDTITIGSSDAGVGVDSIYKTIFVDGGLGSADMLIVEDSESNVAKMDGILTSGTLLGTLNGRDSTRSPLLYENIESVKVKLGTMENTFLVTSTAQGSYTEIYMGKGKDEIQVIDTQGDLKICGEEDDDIFTLYGAGTGATVEVYGQGGNDVLNMTGSGDNVNISNPVNTFNSSIVRWSGGADNDTVYVTFTSAGISSLDIFDDDGINDLNVNCTDASCYILSRETFLANIHDLDDTISTVERINIKPTATIAKVNLDLNEGENKVFFDDTFSVVDIFGGGDRDEFRFGQLYNSPRDSLASVNVNDPIDTVNTTRGFLSKGNSHPISVKGSLGNDFFDVLRNNQALDLDGDSGDDTFVVRSFVALDIMEDGSLAEPELGELKLGGNGGNDSFDIATNAASDGINEDDQDLFSAKGEDPDYVVNSLVDIDGGTGDDRLVVVGTELDDSFVVTDTSIYGGGRTIQFRSINLLELTCEEGNDLVSILSTGLSVETRIFGASGSDQFRITPRTVDPVTSRNLFGHRGIIEHEVSSEDPDYNDLFTEGIAVEILDNDGDSGYINVVETEPVHIMTEGSNIDEFTFYVYPTRPPQQGTKVVVNIIAPSDKNNRRYFTLNDKDVPALPLEFTSVDPKSVTVKFNTAADALERLSITNKLLSIKIALNEDTDDDRFINTEQSMRFIDVNLLPALDSAEAKSVTVVESSSVNLQVLEGGFEAFYDIYLRPCSDDMAKKTKVEIQSTVSNQVLLDKNTLTGANWNVVNDCKVTINVKAVDDNVIESDHFVTLIHTVTDDTGAPVELSDSTIMTVSALLVRIYDNEIGSIILQETGAMTTTAELSTADTILDPFLYEDEYKVRLTKQPTNTVSLAIISQPTASDRDTRQNRVLGRNFEERVQVHVGNETVQDSLYTLVFDSVNWSSWQTIRVTAVDDDKEEGVDLLSFASQPSYLAYIQGPILISGEGSADVPAIADPLLLPSEMDADNFQVPVGALIDNSNFFVYEESQVDSLIVNNVDVRGGVSSGEVLAEQISGFAMGENVVIGGIRRRGGIQYEGLEVVELYFGDGIDNITIVNTSTATYLFNTAGGTDSIRIKETSGHVVIQTGSDDDFVEISSDNSTVDPVQSLVAVDFDQGGGMLKIDNSGYSATNDIVNVTRWRVEFESMVSTANNRLPQDSYLLDLAGATEGTLRLSFKEPLEVTPKTLIIEDYPISAEVLESRIQYIIFPPTEAETCGERNISRCSNAVKVYGAGNNLFAIFFLGERLNSNIVMHVDASGLSGFKAESFRNATSNLLLRASDLAYRHAGKLDIKTGTESAVVNVRGTSAVTEISTQGEDDYFFVSSEASETFQSATRTDFLHGWLDYMEGALTLNAGLGKHRLLISDENSTISKGATGGAAILTENSLTNLNGDSLGDMFFNADPTGDLWSSGVTLWLGKSDDNLDVLSIPTNAAGELRTVTSVHAGAGDDTLNIQLVDTSPGSLFVANGQAGDDVINASLSELGVILFGDGGDDVLIGGGGKDVVFGDFGRVFWNTAGRDNIMERDSSGEVAEIAGGGGFGDATDGVIRNISLAISTGADQGGIDSLILNGDDDVGIGGPFSDIIRGNDGRDILLGDSGMVKFEVGSNIPILVSTLNCSFGASDELYGGSGAVDYLIGGTGGDTIEGNGGMDFVFGDHGWIQLSSSESHKLERASTTSSSCGGGADIIRLGHGDDIAFGGALGDYIEGNEGQDVILGDFGLWDSNVEFLPFQHYEPLIDFAADAGGDTIFGGSDDDFLLGQEGDDTISGGSGNDDITGGHSKLFGNDVSDTLSGNDDHDVILGDNGQIVRELDSAGYYPWINSMVWQTWSAPFNDETIRAVQRYDDIDYVFGDDVIEGGSGNDILHGQRGDDKISGGSGEDEVYGELGSDVLSGDEGDDIILGGLGHLVRRVNPETGEPILIASASAGSPVWKKDIVLEELGNITGMYEISKKVHTNQLLAENTSSPSLLFVGNGFTLEGTKYPSADKWLTELFTFDLVPASNDVIDGGEGNDVCIGQRGDDTLLGGEGNDVLIGDAGTNKMTQTISALPRIYQIYRALSAPQGSGLVVPSGGAVFAYDFELYPAQQRLVDYQGSIVDQIVTMNDVQEESDLIKDQIGISCLSKGEYCLQPVLRITPGYITESQQLQGNDTLISGPGDSILIGDDIRGYTGLDLPDLPNDANSAIKNLLRRDEIDELVANLAERLSTMEVDVEFFQKGSLLSMDAPFDLLIAQDELITNATGQHFVTGDSLTLVARAMLGNVLGSDYATQVATVQQIVERIYDVERILYDLHLALYEIHSNLLNRMANEKKTMRSDQPLHSLQLSNDKIHSMGFNDMVFGDSTVLFFQVTRPEEPEFRFEGIDYDNGIKQSLRVLQKERTDNIKGHIDNDLDPTQQINSGTLNKLPYDDVPFLLTIATDTITVDAEQALAVGDFGLVGIVSSSQEVLPADERGNTAIVLSEYIDTVQTLRQRQFQYKSRRNLQLSQVSGNRMSFYNQRYPTSVRKAVQATLYGDAFKTISHSSVVLGDYFAGYGFGQIGQLDKNFEFIANDGQFFCSPGVSTGINNRQLMDHQDQSQSKIIAKTDLSVQSSNLRRLNDSDEGNSEYFCKLSDINTFLGSHDGDSAGEWNDDLKNKLQMITQSLFSTHALLSQMNRDIYDRPILASTVKGYKPVSCNSIGTNLIPPLVTGGVLNGPVPTSAPTTSAPTRQPIQLPIRTPPTPQSPVPPVSGCNKNGICEAGEDCLNCREDCRTNNKQSFCCSGGECSHPKCASGKWKCETDTSRRQLPFLTDHGM